MESELSRERNDIDHREIEAFLREGMQDIHRDRLIWVDEPNAFIVDEYLEDIQIGKRFYRIIVYAFRDYYFIISGNHRAAALCRLGFEYIPCFVIATERDFQMLLRSDIPLEHLEQYTTLSEMHKALAEKMIWEGLRGAELFIVKEELGVPLSEGIHGDRTAAEDPLLLLDRTASLIKQMEALSKVA